MRVSDAGEFYSRVSLRKSLGLVLDGRPLAGDLPKFLFGSKEDESNRS